MSLEKINITELRARGEQLGLDGEDLKDWLCKTERELRLEIRDERNKLAELQAEKEKHLAEIQLQKEKDAAEIALRKQKEDAEIALRKEKEMRQVEIDREIRLREMDLRVEMGEAPGTPRSDLDTQSTASVTHHSMNFPMPSFNANTDSLEHHIDKFRKLAAAYSLEPTQWALKLAQGLNQEAYEVYLRMAPGTETDFEKLCQALLKRFELDGEAYRLKFRNSKKSVGETYSQFSTRLSGYVTKWRELSGYPKTVEAIEKLFVSEQLKGTMSKAMQVFVAENGATTLENMLTYAERYESAHKEGMPPKAKPQNEYGQDSKAQPKSQPQKPDFKNHWKPKSQESQKPYPQSNPKPYCKICKTNTHHTKDCRVKTPSHYAACITDEARDPVRRNDGTTNRAPVVEDILINDSLVTSLYDTGLNFSAVIAKDLVEPEQYTGETMQIQSACKESEVMSVPVAKIRITSKYVTGIIKAAVMNQPLYQFILGARYVYLAEPKEPVYVGVVQTRSQMQDDPEPSLKANAKPEEIRVAQAQDSSLKACFNKLPKANNPLKKGDFFMKEKLLYRRGGAGNQEFVQLVVPQAYRNQIMEMGHRIVFSGHMGTGATYQRIACHFYWMGMSGDITRYVRSCPECQKVAPKGRTAPVTLGDTTIVTTPFQRVAIDIVGPLPRTKKKNAYILTLMDVCTMWSEAVALSSIDSVKIADELVKMFTRIGFPYEVLSDNGAQFKGKLMRDVFQILQTKHICTSPYHPQANGLIERFNGTLVSMIRKLSQDQPQQWDEYLAAALFAYREVPHASTGYAPATLLFGKPIAGPLDLLKRTWIGEKPDENLQTTSKYVKELQEKLQVGWNLATSNLRKARKRHADYYNRKTKDREFVVGEKVLLLLPDGTNKLEIKWRGPFTIVEKISRTNYRIAIKGKEKGYHINLLRKYYESEDNTPVRLMALSIATEVAGGR